MAIALTCPKIPINAGMAVNIPSTKNGGMDFENMMNIQTSSVELTQNEKDNIKKLLEIVS